MVHKRQLAEEKYEVSPKHMKLDHSCELLSPLQFGSEDGPLHSDKDEGCFSKPIIGVDSGFASGKFTDLPVCATKDVDYTLSGSLSNSSWASSTTGEEDLRSEAPCQAPDYSPQKPRTLIHPEDAYSCLLERPPSKEVPIGPGYQAEIPELCSYGEDQIKFTGSCIIPMPEVESCIHNDDAVGRGRTNCCCRDLGSLRCVQQHINESKETLKRNIGRERFEKLGFGNMGEVVADKWAEVDEQLFHETVYTNPASFGKNFWDHLAAAFPSRTNQEIVSYYFNVFVLRRRAEQNRCDPMSADSDDDEWQGSERSEEDDYSCHDDDDKHDLQENVNHIENSFLDLYDKSSNFSETQPRKTLNSCSFDSNSQPSEKTMVDESGGDDSCTSSDHQFIFEPSDSKAWDVGYFSCSRTKTDFLPTGSMIEAVFGVGSWDFEATDDDKSSN